MFVFNKEIVFLFKFEVLGDNVNFWDKEFVFVVFEFVEIFN